MSALPRKRTAAQCIGMSAKCQKQTHAMQQNPLYSITSSVRASSVCGTEMPSAFAERVGPLRLPPHSTGQ
jgi:hypothetical protein